MYSHLFIIEESRKLCENSKCAISFSNDLLECSEKLLVDADQKSSFRCKALASETKKLFSKTFVRNKM